jgi:deoxyribonuclease IV
VTNRPRIGFHAPISGGLHNALLRVHELGCETVQLFSRNPRGWAARPLLQEEIEKFSEVRTETGISPVVIHANYLINLAAADPTILQKSIKAFREELERAKQLSADFVVVHPGSAKGSCEADGIRTCSESIKLACDGLDLSGVRILLENTAGQGMCIGHRFEHLRDIIDSCIGLDMGVCFDTAHAFTAGFNIADAETLQTTLETFNEVIGSDHINAVHFNDSKAPFHSRVDRHWHIGEGHIGLGALKRVATHPSLSHSAFILETPLDTPGDDVKNVATLRSFFETQLAESPA